MTNRFFAALLAFAMAGSPVSFAQVKEAPAPEGATGLAQKQAVRAKEHMVVAAHPDAAKAGLAMLEKGGSAVDAMIATQLVLGLVEPQSSGLGGGRPRDGAGGGRRAPAAG